MLKDEREEGLWWVELVGGRQRPGWFMTDDDGELVCCVPPMGVVPCLSIERFVLYLGKSPEDTLRLLGPKAQPDARRWAREQPNPDPMRNGTRPGDEPWPRVKGEELLTSPVVDTEGTRAVLAAMADAVAEDERRMATRQHDARLIDECEES